jgi:hypothetical protein
LDDVNRAKLSHKLEIEMHVDTLVSKQRMWGYYRELSLLHFNAGEINEARGVAQRALKFDPQ